MRSEYGAVSSALVPLDILPVLAHLCIDPTELEQSWVTSKRRMVASLTATGASSDRQLSDKLAACQDAPDRRCNLPCCPKCVGYMRKSLIYDMTAYAGQLVNRKRIAMSWLTYDLPGWRFRPGELAELDLRQLNSMFYERYAEAHFPFVVSTVTLRAIQNRRSARNWYWQIQVSSLFIGTRPASIANYLERSCHQQNPCRRETRSTIDEVLFCAIEPEIFREPNDRSEACLSLLPDQLREVTRWFSRYDMADRCVFNGCRWTARRIILGPELPSRSN